MAIAFVNSSSHYGGTSATVDATAIAATSGNAIIVWTGNSGSQLVTGVTDTAGNSYAKIAGTFEGGSYRNECWLAMNITGHATNVVRATFAASCADTVILIAQYSGVHLTSANDTGYAPAIAGDSATPYATNSDSTAEDNELILGLFYNTGATTTFSNGTGTIRQNELDVWVIADRAAAIAGAFTIDVAGDNSDLHICMAAAIKQAAAGSVSIIPIIMRQYRARRS